MHIDPLILASIGLAGVVTGRLLFARWFNHVSLYSLIWGTGLALYEMRLIDYKSIMGEVWMLFGYAWIAFVVGSLTLIVAKAAVGDSWRMPAVMEVPTSFKERRALFVCILVLSSVAFFAVLQHWLILIKRFGSITGVLLNGARIYHLTVIGKITGKVAYFDSFGLTAVCMAGIYCAKAGRVKLLVLFPLLSIILSDVAQGGRVKIIIAGILFFSAYFLARLMPGSAKTFQPISKVRRLLVMVLVLAVMLAAIEFVRSYRGIDERFYGTSKELSSFENKVFITPSIYLYLSSHAGVFNAYWKAGGEQPFPGSNTFAPLFRILSRFDLVEYTPYFTKFYNIPISSNTGTYLRELHADFGVAGILTIPYLLGFLCTLVWFRVKRHATLTSVVLLAHLYVIVAFSFFYQVTRLGQWAVSLIAALLVCSFIDNRDYFRATIRGSLPPNQ